MFHGIQQFSNDRLQFIFGLHREKQFVVTVRSCDIVYTMSAMNLLVNLPSSSREVIDLSPMRSMAAEPEI